MLIVIYNVLNDSILVINTIVNKVKSNNDKYFMTRKKLNVLRK